MPQPTAPPPNKEFLTSKEAREYLGISKPTFFRWRDRGVFRTSKIGGRIYVPLRDLLATLEANLPDTSGDGATTAVPASPSA